MILALLYMTLLAQQASPKSIESTSLSLNDPNNTTKDVHTTINHQQPDDKKISSQAIDVNGTVAEVEQILANNPDLPRLSRDEIIELLSNITSEDQTENPVTETDEMIQKSGEEYMRKMRALMLVLPFNAKNLTESKIKELYTKAPVTRLVSGVPYEEETTTKSIPSTSTKQPIITVTWAEEPSVIKELHGSNHHNVYHEPFMLQSSTSTETTPESSSEHQMTPSQNRRRRPPVHLTSTDAPERQDESSNRPKIAERKPSVHEQRLTTVYPEKTSIYHLDSQQNQDAQQTQTGAILIQQQNSSHRPLRKRKKTTTPVPITTVTTKLASNDISTNKNTMAIDLPSDMKQLIDNFNVHDHIPTATDASQAVFVTPSIETIHMVDPTKQNYLHNSSKYSNHARPVSEPFKTDEIQGILASIGLFPENSTPKQQQGNPITVPTPTSKTTTALPDISAAVDSLTPEMKDLLVSFGLLPSENDIQPPASGPDLIAEPSGEAYNPQASPTVDPSSYLSFKPLPLTASANSGREEDNYAISSDMKEFLASFGLVSDSPSMYRSQKSLENKSENVSATNQSHTSSEKSDSSIPQINVEMLSQDMQDVLANLGFITGDNSTKSKRKTASSAHIFNPSAHLASLQPTDEEAKRLSKLLDTVKKIVKENATLSPEEIEMLNSSIAFILPPLPEDSSSLKTVTPDYSVPRFIQKKKKITPLDQVKSAPDPLSLDELLLNADKQKNEVKRQQSNNETDTSAIETTSSTTESTSTTTTDAGPSLTDLAESFGGGETASSDEEIDDALPPRRPNGLYFLLDWNTFLDVGVEGERRINLRFTPKLGNPRAFIPVTVP